MEVRCGTKKQCNFRNGYCARGERTMHSAKEPCLVVTRRAVAVPGSFLLRAGGGHYKTIGDCTSEYAGGPYHQD